MIGGVLLAAGMAYGQAETPGIDQRQANQEQRIDQGIERPAHPTKRGGWSSSSSISTRWRIKPSPMES